jgi:RimJ/RimL family protein N-acetyltransferase
MSQELCTLSGTHIRLEPLQPHHIEGLVAAATDAGDLYRWTSVPRSIAEMKNYVKTAIGWRESGTAIPFATVRQIDGAVIGSTRFFDIERFPWPEGHARYDRARPDVCEIGYTWLEPLSIRTAANTEAKLLMLTHAFEALDLLRVCLHTDERNHRSRAAIERIGAEFEGILRAHRMASDSVARNSARYSILAAEWPAAKQKLATRLNGR